MFAWIGPGVARRWPRHLLAAGGFLVVVITYLVKDWVKDETKENIAKIDRNVAILYLGAQHASLGLELADVQQVVHATWNSKADHFRDIGQTQARAEADLHLRSLYGELPSIKSSILNAVGLLDDSGKPGSPEVMKNLAPFNALLVRSDQIRVDIDSIASGIDRLDNEELDAQVQQIDDESRKLREDVAALNLRTLSDFYAEKEKNVNRYKQVKMTSTVLYVIGCIFALVGRILEIEPDE